MCGIIGYIGHEDAYPIIVKGLYHLEYRGYDSVGVALYDTKLMIYKGVAKVSDLENSLKHIEIKGKVGMGHTRWATHGKASYRNAHPHSSTNNRLAIVHNGIIENCRSLKEALIIKGCVFKSDTDTEVLLNLIEYTQKETGLDLHKAVGVALKKVIGLYAIVIMDTNKPDRLIATCSGSSLVIGKGKDGYLVSSDVRAMGVYAKNAICLNDNDIARIGEYDVLID